MCLLVKSLGLVDRLCSCSTQGPILTNLVYFTLFALFLFLGEGHMSPRLSSNLLLLRVNFQPDPCVPASTGLGYRLALPHLSFRVAGIELRVLHVPDKHSSDCAVSAPLFCHCCLLSQDRVSYLVQFGLELTVYLSTFLLSAGTTGLSQHSLPQMLFTQQL